MKIIQYFKENYILCLILVVASILRIYHLGFQSLWMDEIYTMNVCSPNNSFSTVISEVNLREGFPYLYFIIIKTSHLLFGYSAIVARMFSVIMGVASVAGIYSLGKELFGKKSGIYAAVLLSVSEYSIYISQDARPYTFYLFGVIMSFYGLALFLKQPNFKNALKYGLLTGLLLNTNFFGIINVFSQAIVILFFLSLISKEERFQFIKNVFISAVVTLVLFLPNIYKLTTLFGFKSSWIPQPTAESFTLMFKDFLGNSEMTLFIFVPLFFYYLMVTFKEKNTGTYQEIIEKRNVFGFTILFAWIFIYTVFIFLKSYFDTSLLVSRYFTSLVPVFFLVFGASIAMIRNTMIRYSILTCLVSFMWFNHDIVRKYYDVPSKTQFREAAQLIIHNNKKNETVYTSLKYWFDYYLNSETVKTDVVEKPNLEAVISEMMSDPTKVKPFWYTDAHGRPFSLSNVAQQFVNANFYIDKSFDGFDAWTKHFILLKDVPREIDISKYNPIETYNGNPFAYSIEVFENTNGMVKASGWAYFDEQDATETVIDLVLIKDGKATRMLSQNVNRPDVTTYFKSNFDLSNSGFSSIINLSDLEPGTYKIGVYLDNKKTKKTGLNISDKTIVK